MNGALPPKRYELSMNCRITLDMCLPRLNQKRGQSNFPVTPAFVSRNKKIALTPFSYRLSIGLTSRFVGPL